MTTMSSSRSPQSETEGVLGSLVIGLYVWLATVSVGLVLLDVVYSNLVAEAAAAFSEVADFLLLVNGVTVLTALGAIGFAWNSRIARSFLVASLLVIILGFVAYALLAPFLQDGSPLGVGIRIILVGSVSILAFAGFDKFRSTERNLDQVTERERLVPTE